MPTTYSTSRPRRIIAGGLPTVVLTRAQLAQQMLVDCLNAREAHGQVLPKLVFSSNGQGIALAGRDPKFKAAMLKADIIHADGQSVVFASRMTATPIPERSATSDFFFDAAQVAAAHRLKCYFLGGSESLNARTVEAVRRRFPSLEIVGRRHGYFGLDEEEAICADIRASGADILWVGLGRPLQEYWSIRNRHRLAGVGWVKTCGGLYNFITGNKPRAPLWAQNMGLEWLHRMMADPRRLGWRYMWTNPYAMYRLATRTRDYGDEQAIAA